MTVQVTGDKWWATKWHPQHSQTTGLYCLYIQNSSTMQDQLSMVDWTWRTWRLHFSRQSMCVSDDRHGMKMDEPCEKSKVLALPAEISLGFSHIFLGMGQHHQPGTCWTYYVKQYAGNLLNHAGHYLQLVFSMAKNEVPIYWRYLLYIRSMFQAYFSGNIPTIHMAWKMLRKHVPQF